MKIFLLRIMIAGVFIVSGSLKIVYQDNFLGTLQQFTFINDTFYPFIGMLLPPVEIILGGSVGIGLFTKQSALAVAGLLLLFTSMYVPIALNSSSQAQCGCFGVQSNIDVWFFARNIFLFACSFTIASHSLHKFSLDALLKNKFNKY